LVVLFLSSAVVALPQVAHAQQPQLTPTPSPAELELARSQAEEGDNDGAIATYRAYVEQGPAPRRSEALLELAKLLLAEGDGASAALHLDAYLLEAVATADVQDAQFLLAEALAQRGDWAGALTLYEAYLVGGGQAVVYARVGRAKALAALGSGPLAETEALALLETDLPAATKAGLILSMAETFEARENAPRALDWYQRMAASGSPSQQALALWRSALIRLQSDDNGWQQDLVALVQRYPSTSSALEAVNAVPALQTLLDPFYVGLVLYEHGEDEEARTILQRALDSEVPANAARASYYLAVVDERAGDEESALEGYERVLEIDPAIELADDALWWHGRLSEVAGDEDGARADYARLAREFVNSDWGREARFRLALLDYDAGRHEEAAEAYGDLAADLSGDEHDRAVMWSGKALAADGDREAADAAWLSIQNSGSYFSLRAAVLLGNGSGTLSEAVPEVEERDWRAIEAWLVGATGDTDSGEGAPLSASERHFRLGRDLMSLGLSAEADSEFEAALFAAAADPGELLDLTREFDALDLHHGSSRAAARLLDVIDAEAAVAAPEDLWRAAYPAPFAEELDAASESNDVPPLLLLSMIRQESFFNPRAGSPAGALGLTQVIGPTGEAIADELEVSDFEIDDLYHPETSLAFGAHYLGEQLDTFDGNIYQALAAYNGGPGNSQRWAAAADEDPDRFYEEIDFAETKLYLKLVGENLARNQQLYGSAERPALPDD
jgi:soluble lytic murein transglycosylase